MAILIKTLRQFTFSSACRELLEVQKYFSGENSTSKCHLKLIDLYKGNSFNKKYDSISDL